MPDDESLEWLLNFDERLFLAETCLLWRQTGRSFKWISEHSELSPQQIEAAQIRGLRCLLRNGATRQELAQEYRFTAEQLDHALGPEARGP